MFEAFVLDAMRVRQTSKNKTIIITFIEFRGACISSKKIEYRESLN